MASKRRIRRQACGHKRRIRRQACGHKRRYLSVEEGRAAIWRLNRASYRGHMNVYKCQFCNAYHVGHRPSIY